MMRRDPPAAVAWVGVTRVWAERAGRSADRATDQRSRSGAAATAGNRTESGARTGTDQPTADIDLCVGRRRREQRHCDARGRKQ